MNQEQAGEILRANVENLAEPLKSAVRFTLETFYQPSATELAKKFFVGLSFEVFMARDLQDTNPELKDKIDTAYFTLQKDLEVWTNLEDLPHEIWRDVIGYENLYQVSNFGRVKSFKQGKPAILKGYINDNGYFIVMLCKDGKAKHFRVHVLVATAFIPNPDKKPEVNHRFGKKKDNRVPNLEWTTHSENLQHAHDIGLSKSGSDSPDAKLTAEQVRLIRKICIPRDKDLGFHALARRFNVHYATIQRIYYRETYKNVI